MRKFRFTDEQMIPSLGEAERLSLMEFNRITASCSILRSRNRRAESGAIRAPRISDWRQYNTYGDQQS
jgi:hypothetical protein